MSDTTHPINIETLVAQAMAERDPKELALGYLRYEELRKLGPASYAELCRRNYYGKNFDEMIDQLITKTTP
jgi:hypothetical protein